MSGTLKGVSGPLDNKKGGTMGKGVDNTKTVHVEGGVENVTLDARLLTGENGAILQNAETFSADMSTINVGIEWKDRLSDERNPIHTYMKYGANAGGGIGELNNGSSIRSFDFNGHFGMAAETKIVDGVFLGADGGVQYDINNVKADEVYADGFATGQGEGNRSFMTSGGGISTYFNSTATFNGVPFRENTLSVTGSVEAPLSSSRDTTFGAKAEISNFITDDLSLSASFNQISYETDYLNSVDYSGPAADLKGSQVMVGLNYKF